MEALLLAGTLLVAYLTDAVFVGLGLALFRLRTGRGTASVATVAVLFALFVLLDLYPFPAIAALDATLHVGNPAMASLLRIDESAPLTQLFDVELFDTAVWALQVVLALAVAGRFSSPTAQPA